MTIIETISLTRRFGALTAVDGLDLSVESGEIFGLLGPNGAGKTTVIKMLTTLLPPTSGRAVVDGHDLRREPAGVRDSIGYVPQLVSADGTLSGRENLLIFAKLYGIPRAELRPRIAQALQFVGLAEAADRQVRGYSGGMVRRLEIAMAMMHRPRVLFLDEPTTGLDPLARQAVWRQIGLLVSQFGMTIFLTTHFMEEADALCGRVAIMHLGRVVAAGRPDDLKAGIGRPGASLEDVFAHYAGDRSETEGNYGDISRNRRNIARLAESPGERSRPRQGGWRRFLSQCLTLTEMELRKLRRDPLELATRAIPTGDLPYLDFMAPGILAQSVLFIAIFYGIAVIWERDLGLVHKLLVAPVARTALVLGKALSAGVRALSQAAIIYLLAWLLGVAINWRPAALLGTAAAAVLGAALFSTFSLIIACIVKTRERFMGVGQILTMPLFFASNAVYPIAIMPDWLKLVARVNPLTYEVDAMRALMIQGGESVFGLVVDFGVLLATIVLLTAIAAKCYPNLAR